MSYGRQRQLEDRQAGARCARGPVLIGIVLIAVAGCGNQKPRPVSRLEARDTPYLQSVPVPAGFKLVDSNSEDQWSGGPRWARHEYRGSAETEAIREFYKEQMPLHGWNRVTDYNVRGTVTIRFERPGEMCDIAIEPDGRFGGRRIQATVMPFQRPADAEPRRPVP